jgi:hypothetical protein
VVELVERDHQVHLGLSFARALPRGCRRMRELRRVAALGWVWAAVRLGGVWLRVGVGDGVEDAAVAARDRRGASATATRTRSGLRSSGRTAFLARAIPTWPTTFRRVSA